MTESSTYLFLLFFSTLFVGLIWFSIQIYKHFEKQKTPKAEFASDLYKLQNKWSKRGELVYCQAISVVLKSMTFTEKEKDAETYYGNSIKNAQKEVVKSEMIKNGEILNQ